jgi:uncharacterized protein (DUF1684 family)
MSEISQLRKLKDKFFKSNPQSPLTDEQRNSFSGLNYFPENPALRFELELERFDKPHLTALQTNRGTIQEYYQLGQIHFSVNGETVTLQVYEPVDTPDSFFVPFVDATAPFETYGAGRYLEPELIGEDKLLVDFNIAYNPYCAYNNEWSCPFPPLANRLKVRIEAGEKKFHS